MKFKDIVTPKNHRAVRIKELLLENSITPTRQDIFNLVQKPNVIPDPTACLFIFNHGTDDQKCEMAALMVGHIKELFQAGDDDWVELAEAIIDYYGQIEDAAPKPKKRKPGRPKKK